ncbi:ferrochelatase [Lysobacter solisilvae (ex Woo and Kim 2020)]|uniref:Ferrochelatase n=1 Tax=Agrilutibacter terrestris TaxID=2865112 RepID=A0A7H0FTU2_9GAMM|nr:ferrochelatase [Lysobacter terrestris]QNP39458.1 ferrochelatase [Lysobacter terrestris]
MITPTSTAGAPTGNPGTADARTAEADTAVVLVNLGTPDAPTPDAVRRYLREFLSDRRVVDLPRWLWWPVLNLAILPLRAHRVAHKYASIWMADGSPLAAYTRRLAQAVQRECPQWRVVHAMRYGAPAFAQVLRQLRADGIRRVLVLPLYPQYSTTTTASVRDVVEAEGYAIRDVGFVEAGKPTAAADGSAPVAHFIADYHLDAGWVAAVAESIRAHRAEHGNAAHLLFSFHGLPQRLADNGDPYPAHCEAGARAIAAALGLRDESWTLTYQSRFGREKWLEPATADTLVALAGRGIRSVDVVAPGFAVDCLETLEEVAQMLKDDFRARGGELRYIGCLNDSAAHARALAAVVRDAVAAAASAAPVATPAPAA